MSLTSKFNPELCQKILTLFKNGDSPFKICKEHGISEYNFRSIILKYPELFSHAKKIRLMNQNIKRKKLRICIQVIRSLILQRLVKLQMKIE
jgi:hypothetical protein